MDHKLWNVFAVDGDYTQKKIDYYSKKAEYDVVREFVGQSNEAILYLQLETEKVDLAETELTEIDTAIEKYKNYKNAAGQTATYTGNLLLQKFEDNAKQTMAKLLQQTK